MNSKNQMSRLTIDGEFFRDESGRAVILRGVNLGGDCKVPYPDGGTERPSDFSNHREVSFIGRPMPLEAADQHFARLQAWGFNVLRLLTTWEAVEHKGPGDYDAEYLDYYARLCEMAGAYGLYVFVDFHQDVWSRMTGGDGAPCWLFEKIGIDYAKLGAADAALVMQHAYDYDGPAGRQEDNYPTMCWSQNANYPANGIMWTLFFAGRDFAPNFEIDGENVQDYMQNHYMACQREVAKRVKDMPHVLGFDTLNEPGHGWIGKTLDKRIPGPGVNWKPIEGLYASHGNTLTIPTRWGVIARKKPRIINPNAVSIWLDGRTDPFQEAGAWKLNDNGTYTILRDDFFQKVGNRKVSFNLDYMFPFIKRVAKNVHDVNPDWIIFAEKDAIDFTGSFIADLAPNAVNASHWYDVLTLATKKFRAPLGIGVNQKIYSFQLGYVKKKSKIINGGCPTLIGEIGIPYDLDGGAAYKKYQAGDHTDAPWKMHVNALDAMYNSLDELLLHSTHWNYTAHNKNDLRVGDCWNQEDLSIFSEDQRHDPDDINSGGRALPGFVRPYAHFVQGDLLAVSFNRKSGKFTLKYRANPDLPAPTEIFVPKIQYPNGFAIDAPGVQIEIDEVTQLARVTAGSAGETTITISRK